MYGMKRRRTTRPAVAVVAAAVLLAALPSCDGFSGETTVTQPTTGSDRARGDHDGDDVVPIGGDPIGGDHAADTGARHTDARHPPPKFWRSGPQHHRCRTCMRQKRPIRFRWRRWRG